MKRDQAGFTLLEMIVVVAICLSMMLMIVPIFNVSSRTVRAVEVKLAVYEAARNILDTFEREVRQAVIDEKGELFCIKNVNMPDTDKFTPAGAAQKYVMSRRECDGVFFLKRSPGARYSGSASLGGMDTPWAQPYGDPDVWLGSLWSSMLYNSISIGSEASYRWWEGDRPFLAGDVQQINAAFGFGPRPPYFTSKWKNADGSDHEAPSNDGANGLAVGRELKTLASVSDIFKSAGGGSLLDLNVAYWDTAERKFKYAPDNTAVYFAPPPRALRFTITVCDYQKRARATLSRIVLLPVGSGSGYVDPATLGAPDPVFFDAATYPYNRAKNLKILQPKNGVSRTSYGIYP